MESVEKLKELEEAKNRIEQAIENFYLEWYFVRRKYRDFDFTYRIEQFKRGDSSYIRLCFGSNENKITYYVGSFDIAVRALMAIRNKLCDKCLGSLIEILENNHLPYWFYKTPLYSDDRKGSYAMDNYIDFEFIKSSIKQKTQKFNQYVNIVAYDINNLIGFYVENYPQGIMHYRPINLEIDLIDHQGFLKSLDEKTTSLFPPDGKFSFEIEKNLGRFIIGRFCENPYTIYFDVDWVGEYFKVRILNIAGFSTEK